MGDLFLLTGSPSLLYREEIPKMNKVNSGDQEAAT
jgi:hypothetical protein